MLAQLSLAHTRGSSLSAVNNEEQVVLHFINVAQLCYLKFLSGMCNK